MASIHDVFGEQDEVGNPPMIARALQTAISYDRIRMSVIHVKNGLAYFPPTMSIYAMRDTDCTTVESGFPWDPTLNMFLIDKGIRSIEDGVGEITRFKLMITHEMRAQDLKRGSGYLNAVFVQFIKDKAYFDDAVLKEIVDGSAVPAPDQTSGAYEDCTRSITFHLSGLATMLRRKLAYSDQWESLLTRAIASYMDDRLSYSNRINLGWV
jgi:hypothetical protein